MANPLVSQLHGTSQSNSVIEPHSDLMWNTIPDATLPLSCSTYSESELMAARKCLVQNLSRTDRKTLQIMKPKLCFKRLNDSKLDVESEPCNGKCGEMSQVCKYEGRRVCCSEAVDQHIETASSLDADRIPSSPSQLLWGQYKLLKCDFCDLTLSVSESGQMRDHLLDHKHYSGSLCIAEGTPSHIVAVEQPMYCLAPRQYYKLSVLACCPDCPCIFPCIYMCGLHWKYQHGGGSHGLYCLTRPISTHLIRLSKIPSFCLCCKCHFSSQRALHDHFRREPSHIGGCSILDILTDQKQTRLFFCAYCQFVCQGSFFLIKSHMHRRHHHHCGSELHVHMLVFQQLSNATRLSLPTFVSWDKYNLERMVFRKMMAYLRSGRKNVSKKLKALYPEPLWQTIN